MSNEEQIRAIPSLVLRGNRQDITALSIKIKQIDKTEKEKLLKVIAKTIYLHRAILSETGSNDTFLALFNVPTRQFKHELEAIRTALDIQKETRNLKTLKIGFGINSGKIIATDVKNNILNYTCLNDAINLAKKLSIKSESSILFPQNVFDKIPDNIKAQKSDDLSKDFEMQVYSLSRIIEREKYNDYIRDFLNRMKKEGAKF